MYLSELTPRSFFLGRSVAACFCGIFHLSLLFCFRQGEDLLGDIDSESISKSAPAEDKDQDDASVRLQRSS